ncbi:MAG: hypothetical protein VX438_12340 [Planctomycetota bacterium]|nr:hypothetical protein [Planctomycetota bacterium]
MKNQHLCVLVLVSFACWTNVNAQGQTELPSAEKILSKYIEVTGGKERYQSIKNAKLQGEMSLPAANLKGKIEVVFVTPNKFHFRADMGALGLQERGSDGKTIWENSTIQGARIIEGEEAEQVLAGINLASTLTPMKYYKSMKTVGKEQVKGEECYVVEMIRKNGDPRKDYYSIKTGLKLKSVNKVVSPMGKIDVESYESNYKKSKNGLLSSWTVEEKVGPNSVMIKMSSVEFNIDLKDTKFDLPSEVQELVDM